MIRATDWRPLERNTLRGFLTLELPSGLILHECTYHRAASGAEWIGLPGRPQLDRDGKQRKDPVTGKALYTPIVETQGQGRARALPGRRARCRARAARDGGGGGMTALDYNADAGDPIVAALEQEKVAPRKRLTAAARLAGQQLELLIPAVLAPTGRGIVAGKFTAVMPGTLLFVLADKRRLVTLHALDQHDLIEQTIAHVHELREFIRRESIGRTPRGVVVSVIRSFLHEHERAAWGSKQAVLPEEAATNTIGTLFAALDDDQIRNALANACEIARLGRCRIRRPAPPGRGRRGDAGRCCLRPARRAAPSQQPKRRDVRRPRRHPHRDRLGRLAQRAARQGREADQGPLRARRPARQGR